MRRMKKWAALLLAAAMVVTSIQAPVYAAATDNAVEVTEVTEDSVGEEAVEEEPAAKETVIEETAAAGEEETAQEEAVGADDTIYVYSPAELVSALDGTLNRSKLDTDRLAKKDITITLKDALNTDANYYDAYSSKSITDSINVVAGKNITLNMSGKNVTLSANVAATVSSADAYKYIKVPSDSSLVINGSGTLPFGIDNAGKIELNGVQINSSYGYALKNSGTASLNGGVGVYGYYDAARKIDLPAVLNSGEAATLIVNSGAIIGNNSNPIRQAVAINDNGTMMVNGGTISNTSNSISANAVDNKGDKAALTLKSAYIYSKYGYGIADNKGVVTMPKDGSDNTSLTIAGRLAGVAVYNKGSVTMENDGATISFPETYIDNVGVITTPYALESYLGATESGTFTMLNGKVSGRKAAVAYSDQLAKLVLGTVRDISYTSPNAAVLKFVSANTIEPDVTKYEFTNSNGDTVGAWKYDEDAKKNVALHRIENGLEDHDSDISTLSGNTVSDNASFKKAVEEGGVIVLKNSITISENIVFAKDTTINIPDEDYDIVLIQNGKFTVNSGIKVNIVCSATAGSSAIGFATLSNNETGITNNGTMLLKNLYIEKDSIDSSGNMIVNAGSMTIDSTEVESSNNGISDNRLNLIKNEATGDLRLKNNSLISPCYHYVNGIYNLGNVLIDNSIIYTDYSHEICLYNEGTVVMDGANAKIYSDDYSDCTAVYNKKGSFVLYDGEVYCDSYAEDSYAIAYEGDAVPTLKGGRVMGGNRYKHDYISSNKVIGSAVVKLNGTTPEMGSFKNSEDKSAPVIEGNNAWIIDNGQVRVDSYVVAKQQYILLEVGEKIEDSTELFDFAAPIAEGHKVTVESSNDKVLTSTLISGNYVAEAIAVGTTQLSFTDLTSGVSDYIRVEVVEKGGRAKLVADSYTGSVLDKNINYNAYKTSEDIKLDWHLKSSEEATGTDAELLAKSFAPSSVVIEDETFNRYFNIGALTQDTYTGSVGTKLYHMAISAKTGEEYNMLVEDNVSEINNIEVKLKLYNKESEQYELFSIGTFNIKVDQTAPGATVADTVTLNSFYGPYAYYDGDKSSSMSDFYPNNQLITCKNGQYQITGYTAAYGSKDYEVNFVGSGEKISYTGSAKTASTVLKGLVVYDGYNGVFDLSVPVKVIYQAPKADVTTKKVTVTSKVADGVKIPFVLSGKNLASVGSVRDVEVVGNDKFTVINKNFGSINTIKTTGGFTQSETSFYVQQNADIKKAEKLTLKVTYNNGDKYINGKEYTSTIKVTVSPAKKAKITPIWKSGITILKNSYINEDGNTTFDYGYVGYSITPSNFKNGYVKVSGYDGKLAVTEPTLNGFYVTATKDTEALPAKTKNVPLTVTLYQTDGTKLASTVVKVNLGKDPSLSVNRVVTMDINKKYTSKKDSTGQYKDATRASMEVILPVKCLGAGWKEITTTSDKFEIGGWAPKAVYIIPKEDSLFSGELVPGESYPMTLNFTNNNGMKYTETITVQIKAIKKASARIINRTDGAVNQLLLYKKAPYTTSTFDVQTLQPYYGMTVANVEIVGNSDYTVSNLYRQGTLSAAYPGYNAYGETYYDYQCAKNGIWAINFKNYKTPVKAKSGTVKLKATYTDGTTATFKVKVTVK